MGAERRRFDLGVEKRNLGDDKVLANRSCAAFNSSIQVLELQVIGTWFLQFYKLPIAQFNISILGCREKAPNLGFFRKAHWPSDGPACLGAFGKLTYNYFPIIPSFIFFEFGCCEFLGFLILTP